MADPVDIIQEFSGKKFIRIDHMMTALAQEIISLRAKLNAGWVNSSEYLPDDETRVLIRWYGDSQNAEGAILDCSMGEPRWMLRDGPQEIASTEWMDIP